MAVPYTFASATTSIPLSELDANFATTITLGNTAIELGNTVTTLNNMTLANVTISSGSVTITDVTASGNVTLSGGTANGVLYLDGSKVATSGTALVFDGTNLGIGTSSPNVNLDVRGATGNGIRWLETSSGNTTRIQLGTAAGFGYIDADAGAGSVALGFRVGGANLMTLDASGNVGIGTSSPVDRLDVGNGRLVASSDTTTPTGGGAYFYKQSNGATVSGYQVILETGSAGSRAERARIDSSGNLLVGTTNAAENAGAGMKVLNTGGTVALVASASTGSQQGFEMYSTTAAAYRLYIDYAGVIHATNTTISSISDQRFKENIRDLDAGLDKIMALKPRKFDWKAGKGKDIKNDRGFIAQEFEQVFPDLIDEWKDPAPEGEEPYKSVRQDLIPVLVKAIQELKADNDDLRARIAALESK